VLFIIIRKIKIEAIYQSTVCVCVARLNMDLLSFPMCELVFRKTTRHLIIDTGNYQLDSFVFVTSIANCYLIQLILVLGSVLK